MVTKKEALEIFKFNPFKMSLIQNKIKDDAMVSLYT